MYFLSLVYFLSLLLRANSLDWPSFHYLHNSLMLKFLMVIFLILSLSAISLSQDHNVTSCLMFIKHVFCYMQQSEKLSYRPVSRFSSLISFLFKITRSDITSGSLCIQWYIFSSTFLSEGVVTSRQSNVLTCSLQGNIFCIFLASCCSGNLHWFACLWSPLSFYSHLSSYLCPWWHLPTQLLYSAIHFYSLKLW